MQEYNKECTCQKKQEYHLPVMAYVPFQELKALYCPEEALRRGTAFPELDKPLTVGGISRC